MLLPSQLWSGKEQILSLLQADGLKLDPAPYREIWEWRFPAQLQWRRGPHRLELRPSLEPWPLICDFPREGSSPAASSTGRYDDSKSAPISLFSSIASCSSTTVVALFQRVWKVTVHLY